MPSWLENIAGPNFAPAVLWTLLALVVLVIVLVIVRIVRSMTFGTFVVGGRNRKTRLAVMDAAAVDSQRRLVLLEEAVATRAVVPGDDCSDARHLRRRRRVEVDDARVRDAGAQRLADEHAGEADVDAECRAAAGFRCRVGSSD